MLFLRKMKDGSVELGIFDPEQNEIVTVDTFTPDEVREAERIAASRYAETHVGESSPYPRQPERHNPFNLKHVAEQKRNHSN